MTIAILVLVSVTAAAVGIALFLQILIFDVISEVRDDLRNILENSEKAARTHNSILNKAMRSAKNAKS